MIKEITLDTHWRCEYVEQIPTGEIDGFDVPTLANFEPRHIASKIAWLELHFDLPIQDVCISYVLKIDATPKGAHLIVNGRDLGEIMTPFALDVTDFVALDDNRINWRVPHGASGAFGNIRLMAIPCET